MNRRGFIGGLLATPVILRHPGFGRIIWPARPAVVTLKLATGTYTSASIQAAIDALKKYAIPPMPDGSYWMLLPEEHRCVDG